MLTIGTLPKAFIGHIGLIQRNAIQSWLQLKPRPQIILFGNEQGTAEIAREFGLIHVPDIASNEFGTPYFAPMVAALEEKTEGNVICFSNCDILLFADLLSATNTVSQKFKEFLLVGECINLDVRAPIDFSRDWEAEIRASAKEKGKWRGVCADFFLFTKGSFTVHNGLIAGRPFYDNWIMYEARRRGMAFVNGTPVITSIHQNHFYTAVPGETSKSHKGTEADQNLAILGGNSHVYWTTDATHILTPTGFQRSWESTLLLRRRYKNFIKKLKYIIIDILRALGLHKK